MLLVPGTSKIIRTLEVLSRAELPRRGGRGTTVRPQGGCTDEAESGLPDGRTTDPTRTRIGQLAQNNTILHSNSLSFTHIPHTSEHNMSKPSTSAAVSAHNPPIWVVSLAHLAGLLSEVDSRRLEADPKCFARDSPSGSVSAV